MTRVKICCIASIEEARCAIDLGAHALGLVSQMPSGPGVIDEERIAQIAAAVPTPIHTFLLTSRLRANDIVEQHDRCRTTTIQLCDRPAAGVHAALRRALPQVTLVQVVHVHDETSIDEALAVAAAVDAVLLDSGNQTLEVKELGGTGRTHDWSLSREIVRQCPVPVYLAGGLDASNVAAAIETVQPYGVDLCSGVRTDDRLDSKKLAAFVAAAAG